MSNSNVEKVKRYSMDRPKTTKTKNKKDHKGRRNKRYNVNFSFNNAEKTNKNFMYQNLTKANCYNSDFSNSNFNYVSMRGASMKSCKFFDCSFVGTEFIGTNLKESNFTNAKFENVVFESAKLADVNFRNAKFINTIFLSTDTSVAKHLNIEDDNITVYKEMPELEMSDALLAAVEKAMIHPLIKKSRVLDTREGKINNISIMILLDNFDEDTLIKGLGHIEPYIERDFYALSFIISLINKLKNEAII